MNIPKLNLKRNDKPVSRPISPYSIAQRNRLTEFRSSGSSLWPAAKINYFEKPFPDRIVDNCQQIVVKLQRTFVKFVNTEPSGPIMINNLPEGDITNFGNMDHSERAGLGHTTSVIFYKFAPMFNKFAPLLQYLEDSTIRSTLFICYG